MRRADSGKTCGPKAAFLGELKHLFPDHVARGIVVPFGAYYDHYQHAKVAVPDEARGLDDRDRRRAAPRLRRAHLRRRSSAKLIPAGKGERELSAWIAPRLEVIRHSIEAGAALAGAEGRHPDGLDKDGLLTGERQDADTVGCFVRSDTNVEDLDNFNGAGLNLTLFNLKSLDDIYEGAEGGLGVALRATARSPGGRR